MASKHKPTTKTMLQNNQALHVFFCFVLFFYIFANKMLPVLIVLFNQSCWICYNKQAELKYYFSLNMLTVLFLKRIT